MKVELEKLRLSMTALTETIVVGIPSKDNISMLHQKDITNDFIATLIEWNGNARRTVTGSDGTEWEITVREIMKGGQKA